jgi:hypothetical protein
VIRDPFHFSDATLIIPPALVGCLELFDGEHNGLDLRAYLVRLTGDLNAGDLEKHLLDALSGAGFLEDEIFEERKAEAERAFAAAPVREPAHAGSGYRISRRNSRKRYAHTWPGTPAFRPRSRAYNRGATCSPASGIDAYRAAYSALARR